MVLCQWLSINRAVAIWHQQNRIGGYIASEGWQRWLYGISRKGAVALWNQWVADANRSLGEDYLMTPRALAQRAERGLSRGEAPLWSQLKCVM